MKLQAAYLILAIRGIFFSVLFLKSYSLMYKAILRRELTMLRVFMSSCSFSLKIKMGCILPSHKSRSAS